MNRLIRFFAVIVVASGAISYAQAASPRQQADPITMDAYWIRLQETLSLVDALDPANAAAVNSSLESQAAAWEAIKQVKLPNGAVAPVDHSYLVGLLRADLPDLDAIRSYLRLVLNENNSLGASTASNKRVTDYAAALSTVLARREFSWEEKPSRNPIQEQLDRLWQRFWDWFTGLFPSLETGGSPIIQWIVGLVGALALALVLVYILRGLVGSVSAETAWQDGDQDELEMISAEGAARRAEETARLGDYRSAVRWLYLSSLLILEERGLLRYDRTRTNREYLRSVAHLPELSAVLRDVIDVFDRVWYGIAPINEADFTRYAARVADLRRMQ